ncbi:nucleoside 2-deoxyribosyltransferase [Bradyrhizobium yuanmingense]|uniref:nucleoside 2-deoxyribosyltransferase n=1 Tax=Bradyrhizobium yuanmingense TaxID=108015 RepID=UPI003CC55ECE
MNHRKSISQVLMSSALTPSHTVPLSGPFAGKCGLEGLYPPDNSVSAGPLAEMAAEIFKGNGEMSDRAQAIVANISPFRGPNMDPGTPWEIGYGASRCLPFFAWSSSTLTLFQRQTSAQLSILTA